MTARLPLAFVAAVLLASPTMAQDVEIGGEVRQRAEVVDAPRFGLGGDLEADAYVLQRILLRAETRYEPVRVVVELGAHEAWGKRGLAPPDEDHLDLQLGYAEYVDAGFTVRVGRQEIALDEAQRFVSYRDGANIRQSYDGARVAFEQSGTRIDAFLVRPVAIERGVFDDRSDNGQSFGGVYLTRRIGAESPITLGGYWLRLARELPGGNERRDSFGGRVVPVRQAPVADEVAGDQHEIGGERVDPGNDAVERRHQRRLVQRAAQPQRGRHVIGRAGRMVELVDEPQPLLRE